MSPLHQIADLHQRTLGDAGVLVRTLELKQRVDVDTRVATATVSPSCPDHDARGVDLIDHCPTGVATMVTPESRATVSSMPVPTNGASDWISGTAWRMHVRAHQGAVRIIVLKERDQRRGDRDTSCLGDTSM